MIKYLWLAFVGGLIFMLGACATKQIYAPVQPQRIYEQIAARKLYPLLEEIFIREGFTIASRDYARGYLSTNWYEYEGQRHGFVKWRERRKYEVLFDLDRLSGKHMLILTLYVEERAPVSTDWRDKEVDSASDEQFQRILRELDDAVKAKGGKLV